MRKMLMIVAASFISATALSAQAAALNLAGEWNASYNTPGGARAFKVVLAVDGAKLTGTVKRETGDSPLEGTVKGDSVTFTYSIKYGDNMLPMTVSAKVVGDAMKGSVDIAGQMQEAFEAKKIPAPKEKPALQ